MPTTLKPILFLDVDGVLNAFAPVRPHVKRQAGGRTVKGKFVPFNLHFDNEVADMVLALAEHFDIVWATMWNHAANAEIAPLLGLPEYPVAEMNHDAGWDAAIAKGTPTWDVRRMWYAKTALLAQYAGDRPYVWVDDDHSSVDRDWLAQHGTSTHFMLVRTDADYGIQWDDVNAAIEWARSLADGALTSPAAYHGRKATVPFIPDYEPVLWYDQDGDVIPEEDVYDNDYNPTDEEIADFLAKLEDEKS